MIAFWVFNIVSKVRNVHTIRVQTGRDVIVSWCVTAETKSTIYEDVKRIFTFVGDIFHSRMKAGVMANSLHQTT